MPSAKNDCPVVGGDPAVAVCAGHRDRVELFGLERDCRHRGHQCGTANVCADPAVDPRVGPLVVGVGGPAQARGKGLTLAKYMILIYGDDQQWTAMSPQEQQDVDAAHRAFRAAAGSRILESAELASAATATSLRADPAGEVSITDGPFLETKEALGGYYVLEAADLDEVIALASRLYEVHAGHSGVEIRPVVDHG